MIVRRSLSWRLVLSYVGVATGVHVLEAAGIVVLHDMFGLAWLSVPALPVTILASTIGILLAFRNNSGYDRWWEARTLWGGLVNQSRSFARQALTFLPLGTDTDAWPVATTYPSTLATDGAVRDRLGRAGVEYERRAASAAAGAGGRRASDTAVAPSPTPATRVAPRTEPRTERCCFDAVSPDVRELIYAQIALVNAIRCHLRRLDPLPEIEPFLQPDVIDALRDQQNVPASLLVWMARRIRSLLDGDSRTTSPADTHRLVALDETLSELTNLLGGCERIKNTPIPRQYDWLPRVVARAYLLFLPLAVVDELGLATPLITAVIAFLFLALDAIGRNVEAPFENDIHDTPMTALCRTIEINLRQMLGETELPPPLQPVNGILY